MSHHRRSPATPIAEKNSVHPRSFGQKLFLGFLGSVGVLTWGLSFTTSRFRR